MPRTVSGDPPTRQGLDTYIADTQAELQGPLSPFRPKNSTSVLKRKTLPTPEGHQAFLQRLYE